MIVARHVTRNGKRLTIERHVEHAGHTRATKAPKKLS
jgi:hypothetical protein